MKENRAAAVASLMLVGFLVLSVLLVMRYVANEKKRDLSNWEDRLAVLAESQKRSVETWLDSVSANLQELAGNPLLQIYLTLEKNDEAQLSEGQRGQVGHLRNLITATAVRSGVFTQSLPISSNQKNQLQEGMGIMSSQGELLMSTRYFPAKDVRVKRVFDKATTSGRVSIHGIYSNENHEPRLVIATPVSAVQAKPDARTYSGVVVAVINPELSLYKILTQSWLTTTTDETLLVKGDEVSTTYMSPLTGGSHAVFHQAALSNDQLAANFSRQRTGDFSLMRDYRGEEVLVTARAIDNTDWILVQKIDASEALRESRAHQESVLIMFLLAVFIITISFIAIWRHATSVRLKETSDRLAARTGLLISIGNNIFDHIFLLDHEGRIVFINKALATSVNTNTDDIRGKSLNHIFSAETANNLLELRSTDKGSEIQNKVMQLDIASSSYVYHVSVVKLQYGEYKESVLYVLHDITSLKEAQDRHNRMLEGIISTLVQVADMHDPHCAHHSERTSEVAIAIAKAMDIDDGRVTALALAALLANIGKLRLPRELLMKMEPLTDEEEKQMHNAVMDSVGILKDLDFDGPVIKIIEQKNEYLDGSGYPIGLAGDKIIREARVLSVANAFVAMSSARAYRPGKSVNDVLDILLKDSDKRYDRQVVAALFHVAENNSNWKSWQRVQNDV